MWTLTDIFFPPRCALCDGLLKPSEQGVCKACMPDLIRIRPPYCMKCGKELSNESETFCADCKVHTHVFESGRALFLYNDAMKKSIYRFKYDNRKEYAAFYGRALAGELGDWIRSLSPACIIPVPLHEKRLKKRGYNQAELIGATLSGLVSVPLRNDLLVRCTDTKKQKELNVSGREKNLKKAFKTTQNNVKLDTVLLIDDIYTTGATMDAAAACLRAAGVGQVYSLSLSIGRNT